MATGNGAYVIHSTLAKMISGYHVCGYNPYWTLFPPTLSFLCRKNHSADLIHTTPDYAYFFRRKNTPLIITFHNYILDSFMENFSSALQSIHYKTDLKYFTKKAIEKADTITCVSKFTAQLIKNDIGINDDIKIIYNGINHDMFFPKKLNQGKKIKVLFSGNLTLRKGANLLPIIAQRLDKNIEILYTSGLRTKNQIHGSPPNLRNLGSVSYSSMPRIYQGADILLFPTVREGFGLAAAEAMSCGLPVITTNCSSLPELVVHGKGGYLCKIGDAEEFATRINELAGAPGLRSLMGAFNRSRVEKKFTMDRMVQQYIELFEQVADRRL